MGVWEWICGLDTPLRIPYRTSCYTIFILEIFPLEWGAPPPEEWKFQGQSAHNYLNCIAVQISDTVDTARRHRIRVMYVNVLCFYQHTSIPTRDSPEMIRAVGTVSGGADTSFSKISLCILLLFRWNRQFGTSVTYIYREQQSFAYFPVTRFRDSGGVWLRNNGSDRLYIYIYFISLYHTLAYMRNNTRTHKHTFAGSDENDRNE